MSKNDNVSSEKRMSKDLQIVAYLKDDGSDTIRDAMAYVSGDGAYNETETRVRDKYVVVDGDEFKTTDKRMYDMLVGRTRDGVSAHHYQSETEIHEKGGHDFSRQFRQDVVSGVEIGNENLGIEKRFGRKGQIDNVTVFKANGTGVSFMGMLKHPSDVEGDDVWEDKEANIAAVTLNIEVNDVSPTVYRWFDNKVIPEIVDNVATHEWVSRHRVMDCEREVSEQGVCYDL